MKGIWRGTNNFQRTVNNMKFSTILQVPNSKNARLLNSLINKEDELARVTGYNVKLVEKSGMPLSRLFQRTSKRERCHWKDCVVCLVPDRSEKQLRTNCRKSNVVYKGTCVTCEDEVECGKRDKEAVGIYVGESSRTLAERASEHARGLKYVKDDNFIVKHWALHHGDNENPPVIRFRVVDTFKDPLSRLLAESVWIESDSNLNSKNEWRGEKITRITVSGVADPDDVLEAETQLKIEALRKKREGFQMKRRK